MTLDPTFRLYRVDPQSRTLPTLADMARAAAAERHDLASIASSLIAKGRLTRPDANERERIWAAFAGGLARPSTAAALAAATWRETVLELRRLIVLRRQQLEAKQAAGVDAPELQAALDRVETLHDYVWTHTATPEAAAARAGRSLDSRKSAA